MILLFRYLSKKLIVIASALVVILIGAVWLTQSLRFIEIIVNHSVSLGGYFALIVYLIPDLMATILPICLLIGGLHVYSKLTADHEIQVIRALGLSNFQISKPLIVLGLFVTFLVFIINIYIIPLSFQKFRNQEYQIKNQFSASLIREGSFNVINGTTAYVRERGPQGEFKGILIYDPHLPDSKKENASENSYTIIAEEGVIHQGSEGVVLVLKRGSRQEKDKVTGNVSFFAFDEFVFDLEKALKKESPRVTKPYEKNLSELLSPEPNESEHVQARMRSEGHQRLLTPWLALVDSLIVCLAMLKGEFKRKGRRYRVIVGASSALLVHIVLYTFLNLCAKYPVLLIGCYSFIAFIIPILLILLEAETIRYKLSLKRKV
ncbi:MAG: YjgP/YjgQ family permease [Alphaproteobacteria bacterium]|nr:YjgP/YjgQ family permease [Alphaproteobacteria bacterium]